MWTRRKGHTRAVVLLHGFQFTRDNPIVLVPGLVNWQTPGSLLVKMMEHHADVYAFAYSQDVSLSQIARCKTFEEGIRNLRKLGYKEIVLVGHSAGGLLARQLVEEHPNLGVTKVIQVCSPNGGSVWANIRSLAAPNLQQFAEGMTQGNKRIDSIIRNKHIPKSVEFVCVVGTGGFGGDLVVSHEEQWSRDLQQQNIRAVRVPVTHTNAMTNWDSIAPIVRLVAEKVHRFSAAEVILMRAALELD